MSEQKKLESFSVESAEKPLLIEEKEEKTQSKCLGLDPRLVVFCISNFINYVGVSQIAPFYPTLAADEAGLNYSQIGFVCGVNPLGSVMMSLVIGSMMVIWGRKKCLILSLLVASSVQILFGCLNYMTGNKSLFFGMSILSRIFQGASGAVFGTVTFSYIPLFWPNEFQQKLAIMETSTALGLLFGPIIGSVLNSLFGFSVPFFLFAVFFLIAQIPIYFLLPPDSEVKGVENKKKLPLIKAFTSLKVVITMMNVTTVITGYIFFNPFFINHMKSFGIKGNNGAFILTIPTVFYIINVNIVPKLQKKVLKSFLMSVSLMISFTGNMLEAPFYDGNSQTITPVIIGLMLVGWSQAFSTLPSIPQLIELLTPVINDPSLKSGVNDMAAALFIMSMSFGNLIGPTFGGFIYDSFGGNIDNVLYPELEKQAFRKSLMVLGAMQISVAVLFFIFGDGYKGWMDMFRRCSSKKEIDSKSQPFLDESQKDSEEFIKDDQSVTLTDTSNKLQSQEPLKTIRIVRQKV